VKFGEAYGVLIEEMRLLARAVLVLDAQNRVTYTEYLDEVTNHPDYEKSLSAVKAIL
jgi:thiol peroxidase